jgi:hypothetical protein
MEEVILKSLLIIWILYLGRDFTAGLMKVTMFLLPKNVYSLQVLIVKNIPLR